MLGQSPIDSPFHAGEQAVQDRLGVRKDIELWARNVIREFLPEEHRDFYSAQPFVVAAARDRGGRPWATLLTGPPGFIHSPDPQTLMIGARPNAGDALDGAFTPGADVGLLGIELATRRRNRVNGRISANDREGIEFGVEQSFGNCPQYISEREWRFVETKTAAGDGERRDRLDLRLVDRIRAADTFFIATGHRDEGEDARFGMDASHRGGAPGFVEVVDDQTLVIPDYSGNNHFNTIGNLVVDPRAGLLFVDFETGGLLQLTGRAEIDWDSNEVARHPGARRLIRFSIEEVVWSKEALPLRWGHATGSARDLRLTSKTRESEEVMSFSFEAQDGQPLVAFEAGQHLPIALRLSEEDEAVKRTYSLSNGPEAGFYRISVKRESQGAVSRYLHDALEVGDVVTAQTPAGDFVLDHGSRPVVLVSAGIGLTPMLSMFHQLVSNSEHRPVWFVHGARDGAHHALSEEVMALANAGDHFHSHTSYSRPRPEDHEGVAYDRRGRVNGELLHSLLPDLDAEFYMCGPIGFMATLQSELEELGVPVDQIHSESFGPS